MNHYIDRSTKKSKNSISKSTEDWVDSAETILNTMKHISRFYEIYWDDAPYGHWSENEHKLYYEISDALDDLEILSDKYLMLLTEQKYNASTKKSMGVKQDSFSQNVSNIRKRKR